MDIWDDEDEHTTQAKLADREWNRLQEGFMNVSSLVVGLTRHGANVPRKIGRLPGGHNSGKGGRFTRRI